MKKLLNQITAVLTSLAMLLLAVTPVWAEDTVVISGNGDDSKNTVEVTETQTTDVTQTNAAEIANSVNIIGDTGGNQANENTGGDAVVKSGDVAATVVITNKANKNDAAVELCCDEGDSTVKIKDNGADSDNSVKLENDLSLTIGQTNEVGIGNGVGIDAATGENEANKNTNSNVSVTSGNIGIGVGIENLANKNDVLVDTCGCESETLVVSIKNNGADSKNKVKNKSIFSQLLGQLNGASVGNSVGSTADTGENEANKNTNGNAKVKTGVFSVLISIFTKVNMN